MSSKFAPRLRVSMRALFCAARTSRVMWVNALRYFSRISTVWKSRNIVVKFVNKDEITEHWNFRFLSIFSKLGPSNRFWKLSTVLTVSLNKILIFYVKNASFIPSNSSFKGQNVWFFHKTSDFSYLCFHKKHQIFGQDNYS